MRARRSFVDRVLDVAVFGPLGFALEARRLVPELAARGREHVDAQLDVLRGVGRFAAQVGRQAVVPAPTRRAPAPNAARHGGVTAGAPPPRGPSMTTGDEIPVRIVDELDPSRSIDEALLAIDGYDALAASQIVARLDGLAEPELRRIEAYERAHRGRRTILHRVTQLLSVR
jgi:hypothetical protein